MEGLDTSDESYKEFDEYTPPGAAHQAYPESGATAARDEAAREAVCREDSPGEKEERRKEQMHMSTEQWKQYSSKISRGGRSGSRPGTRSVMTENEIQTQIRMRLQYSGWYVIRHQQGMGSLKGLSDLSAVKDGKTVYIEVKKPGGVQSQYQKDFQEEIETHGGQYILAKSIDDIEELIEV